MATRKSKPVDEQVEQPEVEPTGPIVPDPMFYGVYASEEMRELSETLVKSWIQFWVNSMTWWRR